MRRVIIAMALLCSAGTAVASDRLYDEANAVGVSDYAATAFYRVEFGAERAMTPRQTFGFQAYNERGRALGMPAMFRAEFGTAEYPTFKVHGLNLAETWLAAGQAEGGGITVAEGVTLGLALLGVTAGIVAATDDDGTPATPGTGSTGGG